ncbi:hypothetical protein BH24ACT19_BH24ACT19_17990 [soil metagenome]|jgi:hypothetical protein
MVGCCTRNEKLTAPTNTALTFFALTFCDFGAGRPRLLDEQCVVRTSGAILVSTTISLFSVSALLITLP